MKTKTYQLTNNMKMVTSQSSQWSWLRVEVQRIQSEVDHGRSRVRIRLQVHSVLRMMHMR